MSKVMIFLVLTDSRNYNLEHRFAVKLDNCSPLSNSRTFCNTSKTSVGFREFVTHRIPVADKLIQMYLLYLLGCYELISTTCLHSHISIYCKLILFNDSKICITFKLLFVCITEQRLVTLSVSFSPLRSILHNLPC